MNATSIPMCFLALNKIDFSRIMSWAMRRFLRGAMVVFGWFVVPYSRIAMLRTAKRKLPAITNPLLEIPAIKLADMIRSREVCQHFLLYRSKSVTI